MRKKLENLFQRKQSYNSMHGLNTSMESTRGGCQRGAGKKWFTISEGWQTTNPSIPLLVVQPFRF